MRNQRSYDPGVEALPVSRLDVPYISASLEFDAANETPDLVTIEAFGHRFENIWAEAASHLVTLEHEQAIYSQFWHEESRTFRHYRIPLRPAEVFAYVEAELAQQDFYRAIARNPDATLRELLATLSNREIAQRVIEYGVSETRAGPMVDLRGCPASFMPGDLEDLVCGQRPERYEPLPRLGAAQDRVALLESMLGATRIIAAQLGARARSKPPFVVEDEYDVQDLVYALLRSVFQSARREEWTPSVAGSSKRIDILIPDMRAVIEVKFVRDAAHAKRVADELKIDFESYHSHPDCGDLFALVFDPGRRITDPHPLVEDLSGTRAKGTHVFKVHVVVV